MPTLKTNKNKGTRPIPLSKTNKINNSVSVEPKIVNLAIHLEKLTAQLNDGRELSIPIDWFAKWGIDNVSASKLKKYEIWRGKNIFFPEINEVLGVEKFIGGFDASC